MISPAPSEGDSGLTPGLDLVLDAGALPALRCLVLVKDLDQLWLGGEREERSDPGFVVMLGSDHDSGRRAGFDQLADHLQAAGVAALQLDVEDRGVEVVTVDQLFGFNLGRSGDRMNVVVAADMTETGVAHAFFVLDQEDLEQLRRSPHALCLRSGA